MKDSVRIVNKVFRQLDAQDAFFTPVYRVYCAKDFVCGTLVMYGYV